MNDILQNMIVLQLKNPHVFTTKTINGGSSEVL